MNDLISVVMTTYNHEQYIQEAVESVLAQDYDNFELIVVDDGSMDNTKCYLDGINNKCIKKIYKINGGVSDAINVGIANASGKWIALMSGDDVCRFDRLSIEYKFACDNDYKIVFSVPDLIDEDGKKIDDGLLPQFYLQHSSKQHLVLADLFYNGNYFCAPSALIQKDVLIESGMFKRSLLQLQDFGLWVEIAKKYDMPILQERLVRYRQHAHNLSGKLNNKRLSFELRQVFQGFFDGVSWETLREAFPDNISNLSRENGCYFAIEKTLLLKENKIKEAKLVGIECLSQLINKDEYYNILISEYGLIMRDYFAETNL